jgi:hypothetical protein
MASLLYLALVHGNFAFNSLAKAAMVFFWRCAGVLACIALVSLPASSCPCMMPAYAESAFEGLASAALAFAGIVLASLSALRQRHCQVCAVVAVTGIALASLPLACRRLCPHCMPLVVAFTLPQSLPYVVSLPCPVSLTPVLCFLPPDALTAMHVLLPQHCCWSVSWQLPPSWSQPSPELQRGVPSGALPPFGGPSSSQLFMLTAREQMSAVAVEWNLSDSLFLGPCWILFSICLPDIFSKFPGLDGGWVHFTVGAELLMIATPNFYQEAAVVVVAKGCVSNGVED